MKYLKALATLILYNAADGDYSHAYDDLDNYKQGIEDHEEYLSEIAEFVNKESKDLTGDDIYKFYLKHMEHIDNNQSYDAVTHLIKLGLEAQYGAHKKG